MEPNFLSEVEEKETCDLAVLADMVSSYERAKERVEVLEAEIAEAKKNFIKISQEDIPQYLYQYGLSEIKMKDGKKVVVKDDISVSIKDKSSFSKFLEDRNESDIEKINVVFGKLSDENQKKLKIALDAVADEGIDFCIEKSVHAQTVKAYFRALLGVGLSEQELAEGYAQGAILPKDAVESFVNIFSYSKTTIK